MSLDFAKKAHILVVHGVQTGSDGDIDVDEKIRKLVARSLERSHLDRDFDVRQYLYEDINDDAQRFYKLIAKGVLSGQPLAGRALSTVIDLVGDVVTAAAATSTAGKIRKGLKKAIRTSYDEGHRLVVVAHSLGTVYALDVLSQMMRDSELFVGDDRRTWPAIGLITMGSPLGLNIDLRAIKVFEHRKINPLSGGDYRVFPWHNYYNVLDPIVTGNVLGVPIEVTGARGPVESRYGEEAKEAGWLLQGHKSTAGRQWLLAHIAYWKNRKVGSKIVDLLWG
jgi:hypothetical protein